MVDVCKYEKELSYELSNTLRKLFNLEFNSIVVNCLNYPIYEFTVIYKINDNKYGFSCRFISEEDKENEKRYLLYSFFERLTKNI